MHLLATFLLLESVECRQFNERLCLLLTLDQLEVSLAKVEMHPLARQRINLSLEVVSNILKFLLAHDLRLENQLVSVEFARLIKLVVPTKLHTVKTVVHCVQKCADDVGFKPVAAILNKCCVASPSMRDFMHEILIAARTQTEGKNSDVIAIGASLLDDLTSIIGLSIGEQEDSLLFAGCVLSLGSLQRL